MLGIHKTDDHLSNMELFDAVFLLWNVSFMGDTMFFDFQFGILRVSKNKYTLNFGKSTKKTCLSMIDKFFLQNLR